MISSVALPNLPPVPNNGRGRLVADISYDAPETRSVQLGSIPRANWDMHLGYPEFVSNVGDNCNVPNGWPVWVNNPLTNPDGSVKMETVTQHVDAHAKSLADYAFGVGALAAVGGAAGAGLAALLAGAAPWAIGIGAVVGATLAGGVSAKAFSNYAAHDHIRLKWQETPVVNYKLDGYVHDWGGDQEPHRYTPQYAETKLGTSYEPVVEHYRS